MSLLDPDFGRDFYRVGNKYVCANCFDDYAICDFVRTNAKKHHCDYCDTRASEAIAAPIDDVIEFLIEGIGFEWGDPYDMGAIWDSETEDWFFGVIDSSELIFGEVVVPSDNVQLLEDITGALSDRQWSNQYLYCLPEEKVLINSWQHFSEQVKHHTRYVFFRSDDEEKGNEASPSEEIPPSKMLDRLGKVIAKVELTTLIELGTILYRARVHSPDRTITTAQELGSPPISAAIFSNRMSPAGIPMFYGAFDANTALVETYYRKNKETVATIAAFETLQSLRVLDLTKISIPSLFDDELRWQRPFMVFLKSFVQDITKPIDKDGQEHIDYVPTQIVTEFFRHVYRDSMAFEGEFITIYGERIDLSPDSDANDEAGLDGIVYPSAQHPGGKACVLFIENDQCTDKETETNSETPKLLLLKSCKRVILAK